MASIFTRSKLSKAQEQRVREWISALERQGGKLSGEGPKVGAPYTRVQHRIHFSR